MANTAVEMPSPVEGVTLLERKFKSKAHGSQATERLYRCDDGWSLGARRGGALHLADAKTWEVFVLTPMGIAHGESVGFVGEDQMVRMVALLNEAGR